MLIFAIIITVLGFVFGILSIIVDDQDSRSGIGTFLIVLIVLASWVGYLSSEQQYKQGQIDALNGDLMFEYKPRIDSTNTLNWIER